MSSAPPSPRPDPPGAVAGPDFPRGLAPPSYRVLVLESEAGPQQNLSHVLRREGFTPVTCETSSEAAGHLRREAFIVALVGQPADDGGETSLLREAQTHAGDLRVILLVAADSPRTERWREHLDAVVCLGRPYDPTQLISQVHWAFHHHLQQALSSVSHFQRRITETVPEHIYVYDLAERRTVYSNRRMGEVLGYDDEELHALGDAFSTELLHPDDRERFEAVMAGFDTCDDSQIVSHKYRMRHRDGGWRWLETRGVVFAREPGGKARRILGVLEDVTESELADEALRASREELRRLAAHLQRVREKERGDIAREVHDQLGQTLTAMKLQLAWLQNAPLDVAEPVGERLEVLGELIDATVSTVRRIARELRPQVVEDLGLIAAIRWQTEELAARYGLECRFRSDLERVDLPVELSTHLFRILQESLTNALRHAQARTVEVSLEDTGDGLTLTIADDGRGITREEIANTRSIGLIGIRERAVLCGGRVSISRGPEGGTRIVVWVPWPPASPAEAQRAPRHEKTR